MEQARFIKPRGWRAKFRAAFRGAKRGVRGQSSFFVHFFTAAAVVAAGAVLGLSRLEWALLLLAITIVLVAEMFNSALEWIALAADSKHNPHLAEGLDIGSGAVLLASIGSTIVGLIVFGQRLIFLLG